MIAEQVRDALRAHIFVNRQHEVAGLDEAAQAVLALFAGADAVREALKPFAAVAEYDIGETEADADIYRPMSKNNRAPLLTIGDLRRACAALLLASQK